MQHMAHVPRRPIGDPGVVCCRWRQPGPPPHRRSARNGFENFRPGPLTLVGEGAEASVPRFARLFVFALGLGDAFDRDDALLLGGVEDDDALRGAAGDADAADRHANELAAIGSPA